jgi:glucosyl-dolichyl phosphate glucuronosyltransferase
MNITLIVCTYNRCRSLTQALNSAAASTLRESIEWEILVVDNNSSDQTREVIADFCRRYPRRFRYLFEPQQGLSNARNAGIREARGDVIAFTDDDVTLEPAWLQNLTTGLCNGAWAGAGGRILPEWECLPPRWLSPESRDALAPLAMVDHGSEAGELVEAPVGANMAFRKEMFEKYGAFRTDLGRSGGSMIGDEDTEFGDRLLAAGERLRYEPGAVVYHPVTESRIRKKYFLNWYFGRGRSTIRRLGAPPGTKWYIWRIPLYLFRRLAVWSLRWMVALESSRRFSNKVKVWSLTGQIVECATSKK